MVIVGAGFGGLTVAKNLAKTPVDVTLIDRENHHLFQPLLYQVATAGLSPADIASHSGKPRPGRAARSGGLLRRAQAPEDTALYRHDTEGADDMPAHIKGALTQTHLAVPICDGELLLGRYQGIFVFEHRGMPRAREIVLHFEGQ